MCMAYLLGSEGSLQELVPSFTMKVLEDGTQVTRLRVGSLTHGAITLALAFSYKDSNSTITSGSFNYLFTNPIRASNT